MSPPPPGPRATRREWIGLAVLALPCLLYSMNLTVLNLALPRLSEDLTRAPDGTSPAAGAREPELRKRPACSTSSSGTVRETGPP
ncbi:MAG: hypothetical protein ABI968_11300 [Acidobacteriota bacterium]